MELGVRVNPEYKQPHAFYPYQVNEDLNSRSGFGMPKHHDLN